MIRFLDHMWWVMLTLLYEIVDALTFLKLIPLLGYYLLVSPSSCTERSPAPPSSAQQFGFPFWQQLSYIRPAPVRLLHSLKSIGLGQNSDLHNAVRIYRLRQPTQL